ncbi:uncharacterized protein B0P05DRAFT_533359 [Gilbertella persicaria]|uniref:NodB homology domain-containing protein n=1 Tax=Rhizopus stolonifer TaxID=4846 RepID=A0A367KNT1_RHIST|nr:uncharacterized protein B0P05DRAFT_533359 [Gilbertella persicaria]KAI8087013.1 hypothetical protein B0P05DRAFT_533359 [Gilbertella persicaria]RCI03886.1 hypothetical protein CU098_012732 [Rhizopus stolonifer]
MLKNFVLICAVILHTTHGFPTKTKYHKSPTVQGILPVSSPAFLPPFPLHGVAPASFNTANYPEPWRVPDTQHPEVQAAIRAIDWDYVPRFEPQHVDSAQYDSMTDEACWWSFTQCTRPKVSYLPDDVKTCPQPGDFGLSFDDGPLLPTHSQETRLYDFLASERQTATLFYIGSNIISFPGAVLPALQSGHTLCAHTWSHPHMTSLSNEEVVAELYWTMRAIKEAAGVTTRCWRPSYGDVDDRVRAIAHQLGLHTIVWDSDSFDWGVPSASNNFGGTTTQEDVDGYFESWIEARKQGGEAHGRIALQHENSDQTIAIAMKWLNRLKGVFRVQKIHDCEPRLPSPYWEA